MSWSRGPRSRVLVVLAALTLACGLAGCFQPLYSEAAHPGLVEDLRAIEVAPIKDRIGHYLADNLTTDLNGTGQTPPPKYRLTVTVTTGTSTPTVSSLTNVATSATMTAEAPFYARPRSMEARRCSLASPTRMRPTIVPSSATTICAPRETPRFVWRARCRRRSLCVSPRSWPGKPHESRARRALRRAV